MDSLKMEENILKEMFGVMKSKKPTEKMIAETRKELESKWIDG